MRLRKLAAAAAAIALSFSLAKAETLASYTSGATAGTEGYYGEAFTAAGTGSYTNIAFSFFTPAGAPTAVGTGYLFSSAFTGTPEQLSSTSANLLGSAVGDVGQYRFGSDVVLNAGSNYFFYEDGLFRQGGVAGNFFAASAAYVSFSGLSNIPFSSFPGSSADFIVLGTAATPEPSSLALLGTGVLGVIGAARRRFAA